MFGIITKKKLKIITDEISKDININKNNISTHSKDIIDMRLLVAELKGMIKVREQVANSPQTTSNYHKKAKKIADKVQILAEMKKLINKDFSTQEMYNSVVLDKGLCRKTCFYKYLKIIREQELRTSQTKKAN